MKSNGEEDAPEFFVNRREQFINQCINMGMDFVEVKDFLEDKGIVEENLEIIIDHMKSHSY